MACRRDGCVLSASGCAVVASSGDGGFNMKLGGLETARQTGCG
jgi:thiamine pyrophosphate-dependent acetolactate synthase large subunit-like protein